MTDLFSWFLNDVLLMTAKMLWWMLREPYFYALLLIVLALEKVFPAKPSQKTFSVGFFQDLVWVCLQMAFRVALIALYVNFLTKIYRENLNFLTLRGVSDLPGWVKYPLWLLAVDFFDWLHHWVRHKVPWFWQFHAIHHSQRELNVFTDLRYHGLEYVISNAISVFPLLMLQADIYSILGVSFVHDWYTRAYHSNIRSNYGFLRYVLVTPQSHRIHHSIERKHSDKNFGVLFSFWDRLFGTHYPGCDEYPDTGISDRDFPLENGAAGLSLFWNPVRQHLYPFQVIAKDLWGRFKP